MNKTQRYMIFDISLTPLKVGTFCNHFHQKLINIKQLVSILHNSQREKVFFSLLWPTSGNDRDQF